MRYSRSLPALAAPARTRLASKGSFYIPTNESEMIIRDENRAGSHGGFQFTSKAKERATRPNALDEALPALPLAPVTHTFTSCPNHSAIARKAYTWRESGQWPVCSDLPDLQFRRETPRPGRSPG